METVSGMEAENLGEIYNLRLAGKMLATAGQPSEEELAAVARAGYEVVINLALHDDPRYSLPDERVLVESLGMSYIHIPVVFSHPTLEDLAIFFDAMESNTGKRIFLHCAANMRVSTFLGLFRTIRLNWDQDRAFALMREIWTPDPIWTEFIEEALNKFGLRVEYLTP